MSLAEVHDEMIPAAIAEYSSRIRHGHQSGRAFARANQGIGSRKPGSVRTQVFGAVTLTARHHGTPADCAQVERRVHDLAAAEDGPDEIVLGMLGR